MTGTPTGMINALVLLTFDCSAREGRPPTASTSLATPRRPLARPPSAAAAAAAAATPVVVLPVLFLASDIQSPVNASSSAPETQRSPSLSSASPVPSPSTASSVVEVGGDEGSMEAFTFAASARVRMGRTGGSKKAKERKITTFKDRKN